MQLASSKGVLLVTMATEPEEIAGLDKLSKTELTALACSHLSSFINMKLVKDTVVEVEEDKLKVLIRF